MKAPIAQSCVFLGKAQDNAIGAFVGLHGQNLFEKIGFGMGSN
jgi:hypothetical protein